MPGVGRVVYMPSGYFLRVVDSQMAILKSARGSAVALIHSIVEKEGFRKTHIQEHEYNLVAWSGKRALKLATPKNPTSTCSGGG